jgi:hypothetical protein
MIKIKYEPFVEFCKTKINQDLETIVKHAKFRLTSVQSNRLDWVVLSTNKPHYSTQKWIEKYINYFNQTNSFCTSEYNRNIHCTEASNILALIKLYIESIFISSKC